MAAATDGDETLKRLGGGRWQTRDERFTIEPQSGTWVVVDAEQTDDLGLPLIRGPYGSLGAAKTAIADARTSEPARSTLPERAERIQGAEPAASAEPVAPARPSKSAKPAKPTATDEPGWVNDLDPEKRRRARRLVERLTAASAHDAEGIARRDIVGQVPAAAAYAVLRQILALESDALPTDVARILADGRDDDLGVRWRLVDGDGRPITLDFEAMAAEADR